jgi:hypothetical protein
MRRAVAVVVVAAVALLVASSCSGSSDDSGPRPPTSVPVPSSEAPTSSAVPESTTTTAAAGPEACRGPGVEIAYLDSRAAAGHSLAIFVVRNPTTRPCRLSGHPAVEVLDASGRVLATARRGAGSILGGAPPAPVTVAPRGNAYFAVESESVCADDAPPAESDRVRVVLPEDATPAEAAVTITVCPEAEVLVSPVRAAQAELAGG